MDQYLLNTTMVVPLVLFLLTLAFGLWLMISGKPYNGIIFNIHKLLALAAVVLAVIRLTKEYKISDASGLFLILLVAAGLCGIVLFVSGALMSASKLNYQVLRSSHKIAAAGLVLILGLGIALLGKIPKS